MGEIHACRVCMSTNVKLYNMFQNNLITAYELLMGLEVILENRLPSFICVVCSHLLLKFTEFRETCQRTHDLLIFSYQRNDEVSTEYIECLKLNCSPLTKLSAHIVVHHDVTKTVHPDYSDLKVQVLPTDYDASQTELDPVKTEECSNQFSDEVVSDDASQTELDPVKTEECSNQFSNEFVMDDTEVNCKDDEAIEAETDVERPPRRKVDEGIKDTFTVTLLTVEQQLQELRARKLSMNYRKSLYKCEKCFRGFMTEVTFRKHMARHDPVCGGHECEICLRRLSTARMLRRHVIKYHEKEYRCKLCSFVTKTNCQAVEHAKEWHSGKVFICNTCGATFRKGSSYLTHVRLQHSSPKHVCDICGESFVGARGLKSLRMHAKKMHEKKAHKVAVENKSLPIFYLQARFTCDSCKFQFKTKKALVKHIETSAGECLGCRPCVQCGEDIGEDCDIKKHLETHGERKKCDQCKRTFSTKRLYALHVQRVDCTAKKKPTSLRVVCEICGKAYRTLYELIGHQRSHTGETPYACNMCPKRFTAQKNLKAHVRTHTGEAPHVCSDCPKKFTKKAALNRHLTIHTGEKPYSCDYCEKSFAHSNSVKQHIKNVHLKLRAPYKNKTRSKPKEVQPRNKEKSGNAVVA